MSIYDAVIIGGGPAGLTAALYLLRSGAKTLMLERMAPGGQVLMTEEIENYPGFPKGIKGYELVDLFQAQVDAYGLERRSDEVTAIEPGEGGRHVVMAGDERIETRTVILASGAHYRKLGVPGEKEYLGKGVSYCALCDGNFYRGRKVAVVGGGNAALEESLYLARIVDHVTLIHRRDEFRGQKCYEDKCAIAPKMTILRSTVVESIDGDAGGVTGVSLKNVKTGAQSTLAVDGVFVFVGFDPNLDYLPAAVKRDKNGVLTDCEMRTSVPGIFAAGDARSKLCRQVATAVGDGATAANTAHIYLESLDA
ncbi:MAG: thioredoxin-disulfide reductase [Desulfovibrionaceae bacterium]